MRILVFSNQRNGTGDSIQGAIESVASEAEIEIFNTLEGLYKRIRQPKADVSVLVLAVADSKALCELISIQDLFDGIPMILILPDWAKDTVSLGHKLYPRFISYADSDFSDVSMVIRKMINRSHPQLGRAV